MKNISIARVTALGIGVMIGAGGILLTAGCMAPASEPEAAPVAASTDWRDGLVPCETPTGNTMTVGCYWDKDGEPYVVTDDGEKFLIDEATGDRTYVEWEQVPATDPIEHFSDGSWWNHDTGEQGCDADGSCASLPPVPAGEPMTPNGGYYPTLNLRPCLVEDATDCYWWADEMGNGQGRSFVNIDGEYYYKDAE